MSDFQLEILKRLDELDEIKSTLATFPQHESQDVLSALNSLKAHAKLEFSKVDTVTYELTKEGAQILSDGSYEIKLVKLIQELGHLQLKEVMSKLGPQVGKVGQARAFKNGWIAKNDTNELELSAKLQGTDLNALVDETQTVLAQIKAHSGLDSIDAKTLNDLKKRKLVVQGKITDFHVTKGADFSTELTKLETDLTSDMVSTMHTRTCSSSPTTSTPRVCK